MNSWKIFEGNAAPHEGLTRLPDAPPWRFGGRALPIGLPPPSLDFDAEKLRAMAFLPTPEMVTAVNAALYLRRPLLLTGKAGTGKSTLISKVANELRLGPVLRWPITSRSTVRSGIYEYDAVGRLQAGDKETPPVQDYLTLGPLGTALLAREWPRALLIDEIDKSDLDFANDLLNVIEEGYYDIPELVRLKDPFVTVLDGDKVPARIEKGHISGGQFPFVVMTNNGEREFPAPFLRRCIRLTIQPPDHEKLLEIVKAHLHKYLDAGRIKKIDELIYRFEEERRDKEISTDQLLNAVFLTIALDDGRDRTFDEQERDELQSALFQQISGSAG